MQTCYRHPSRETGVSCSSCGRPICPDCMTPTPVGMRCPECSKDRTRVHTVRSLASRPTATYVLVAINVIAYVAELASGSGAVNRVGGSLYDHGALFGPAISNDHEVWRIVTSGFLHATPIHILFNMYLLYMLGQMLEPALGSARFGALYAVSLLGGSFLALLVSPLVNTVGASGAVFGLMGGAVVFMHSRGIDPMASGIGPLILINLVISFVVPGISWGGHVGGLIAGGAVAWVFVESERRSISGALQLAVCTALAVVLFVGAIAVAGGNGV